MDFTFLGIHENHPVYSKEEVSKSEIKTAKNMEKGRTIKLRNPFVYQGYVSPDYFCVTVLRKQKN